MKTFLLVASIALASGKPAGEGMSLKAEVLPNVQASSAPAYWSAQCGDHTYAGSYTQMMDWAACQNYCWNTLSLELGQSFSFADILDSDTMECLRYNMNSQYTPGNGYAGHYWVGAWRQGVDTFTWISGEPFTYDDFVEGGRDDLFIHLTPGNNYSWNTKNDQNDKNNGCLCKSM